jgi:hypothetical protein
VLDAMMCDLSIINLRNSLYFSLLAGNLPGEGFASDCLLRHTVCTLEKFRYPFPPNGRKMPIFRDIPSANRTAENGLLR